MRIPNPLTGASFATAIMVWGLLSGQQGVRISLAGAAAGIAPMLFMYAFKGVGAGDVKLFAALGAWLGVQEVLELQLYSILYAGAVGLLLNGLSRWLDWPGRMLVREDDGRKLRSSKAVPLRTIRRFPFMLAVAPAFVTCWWYVY